MKRILVLFRKLYYRILFHMPFYHRKWADYTPAQKELFETIAPGDIIEAWMPFSEDQMRTIPEKHRRRPWYVVEVHEGFLTAFKGSSSSRNFSSSSCYMIPKERYNVWKNGYVNLSETYRIPVDCLIRKLDHLSESDLENMQRIISMLQYHGRKIPSFCQKLFIRKNDMIVWKSHVYFVLDVSSVIRAVQVEKKKRNHDSWILANNHICWFDAGKIVSLNRNDAYSIFMICKDPHIFLPEKKHPRPDHYPAPPHTFTYSIGQIFEQAWNQAQFVYLYSSCGKDYGVCLQDMEDGQYEVRLMQPEYLHKKGLADDETMTWVINNLIAYKPKEYGWMQEWMETEPEENSVEDSSGVSGEN